MIRMIQSQSSGHAKTYFSEALAKSDYYIGDQELNGNFQGQLAERLGISGIATKERFFALCENRHPNTGIPLSPRTKTNRRIGYDINFHVPKSVSILHALSKDDHILKAFHNSVTETMKDIEAEARVRVRKGGAYDDRKTGELLWVDFIHQTARPVEGFAPDPHLHAHCFVFNFSWDETEQRIKAAQFGEINREMPYYQALFHKRLANNLIELGYRIRPTAKAFEVAGVPQQVIDLFAKRTDEIGRIAKERNITDAKALSELGARTRAKKETGLTMEQLRTGWRAQIKELDSIDNDQRSQIIRTPVRVPAIKDIDVDSSVDFALSHCFERASVVSLSRLTQTALEQSVGTLTSPEAIDKAFAMRTELIKIKEGNRWMCTTREVLQEEQRMVQLAIKGKNVFAPLYGKMPDIKATGQQKDAICHVLSTSDMVSIIRGAAGAGKTTLMKEAISYIEKAGKRVFTVAPTARAARGVLKDEGFDQATTVASLLANKTWQKELEGQVLWVDEAGMLGTKDMAVLLELVTRQRARLILGGDTRQHASVVRGDALRILNTVAGIKTAEVNKIYRQRDVIYRSAISEMATGKIRDSFAKLETIGAIKKLDKPGSYTDLVDAYVFALKNGKDVLTISPTHAQGEQVNAAIRERLKAEGLIGKKQLSVTQLKNLSLTSAQKTDWRNFEPGLRVQFNQNQPGINRGSIWSVEDVSEHKVNIVNVNNQRKVLDLKKPEDFELYRQTELPLSKGDKVQITRNGFDRQKQRLNNGTVLEVSSISKKNGIILTNGRTNFTLNQDFGHLSYAHCITSHASQGKTVDEVFIAQPSTTFAATNAKQFYVSASRARDMLHIYTDDKGALMEHAAQIGDRRGAAELVKAEHHAHELQRMREMERQPEPNHQIEQIKSPEQWDISFDDYEPGF